MRKSLVDGWDAWADELRGEVMADRLTWEEGEEMARELRGLAEWLWEWMKEPERELPTNREVVPDSKERVGKLTVQLEYVKCGQARCKNDRHGPYWYGYYREGGKLKKVYIGKDLEGGLKRLGM